MINEKDLDAFETMFGYWGADYGTRARVMNMTPQTMSKEFIQTSGQKPDADLYKLLIREEFDEFIQADSRLEELKELADLVYVIYGYANAKGYDLDNAVRRVHINNIGRMYQADGTIHRREDGKIIKNPDYPKVNLEDLI